MPGHNPSNPAVDKLEPIPDRVRISALPGGTPFPPSGGRGVLMAYAWPPRPSTMRSIGAHHIVLTEELHVGRLHRQSGDALCKPARKFWGLDTHEGERRRSEGQRFDCLTCLAHNDRLGLVSASECGRPAMRSYR